MQPGLDQLRRHAVARSLFPATTLPAALTRLGFVQADPIRAPARAQDLTLRQRVRDYRSGDLERRYAQLGIEEDFFVNYGFVTRDLHRLMHPRAGLGRWTPTRRRQAADVLAFVIEHGIVHPREVDAAFAHGRTRNWFGGTSNASTQLLDEMHYRGLLRVAGRASGVRLYAPASPREAVPDPSAALDALVDAVVAKYAPLPQRSLAELVSRLRHGAPQWQSQRAAALQRALRRLPQATVDGVRWLWAPGENPAAAGARVPARARLLAPFDPVVWDRRRFELLWGWTYRFEAYTPAAQRVRGYYALPLLWRDRVVGWGNLTWRDGRLGAQLGYVSGRAPREAGFGAALDRELDAIGRFLDPSLR